MPENKKEVADAAKPRKPGVAATIKKRWRGWLRAIHRDFGYLAVGFTIIYALSGLAVNHIQDWDSNFKSSERTLTIAPIPAEVPDDEAVAQARKALGVGVPTDVYRAGDELHLSYDHRKIVIYGDSGEVTDQSAEPRFFLRVANWLHLARGKPAWNYLADTYAVMLLYLAISGLFMIKGRLGLKWRGAILVTLGFAVPITYVVLSGGPDAKNGSVVAPADTPVTSTG